MGQGERADRVGVARESDHPDEIGRAAGKVGAVSLHELFEDLLRDVETCLSPAAIAQFGRHAARTVDDHFDGDAPADIANLLGAYLRPGERQGQQQHHHDAQDDRQPHQSLSQGYSGLTNEQCRRKAQGSSGTPPEHNEERQGREDQKQEHPGGFKVQHFGPTGRLVTDRNFLLFWRLGRSGRNCPRTTGRYREGRSIQAGWWSIRT